MVNLYEDNRLQATTGETLRPGGYDLTEKLVARCHFKKGHKILDLGCGNGATIHHLNEKYGIAGWGIDPSTILLEKCREKNPSLYCIQAKGEAIPFDNNWFDGVLSECSLSLMDPFEDAVKEVYRVLHKGGFWGISDLYAKNPQKLTEFAADDFNTCVKKLHNLESLIKLMEKIGFKIIALTDESYYLKKLMVELVFQYGSMNRFWMACSKGDAGFCDLDKKLKACKPGYFSLIVQK